MVLSLFNNLIRLQPCTFSLSLLPTKSLSDRYRRKSTETGKDSSLKIGPDLHTPGVAGVKITEKFSSTVDLRVVPGMYPMEVGQFT